MPRLRRLHSRHQKSRLQQPLIKRTTIVRDPQIAGAHLFFHSLEELGLAGKVHQERLDDLQLLGQMARRSNLFF